MEDWNVGQNDIEICHWDHERPWRQRSVRLIAHSPSCLHFKSPVEIKVNDHLVLMSTIKGGPPYNGLYAVTQAIATPGFYVMEAEFICLLSDEGHKQAVAMGDAQLVRRLLAA